MIKMKFKHILFILLLFFAFLKEQEFSDGKKVNILTLA